MLLGPYYELIQNKLTKLYELEQRNPACNNALGRIATAAPISRLKETLVVLNSDIDHERIKSIEEIIVFQNTVIQNFTIKKLIQILFFPDHCIAKMGEFGLLKIILKQDPFWNKRNKLSSSPSIFKDICLDILNNDLSDKVFLCNAILLTVQNKEHHFLRVYGKNYIDVIAPAITAVRKSCYLSLKKLPNDIEYTPHYKSNIHSERNPATSRTFLSVEKPTISGSGSVSPVFSINESENKGLSPTATRINKIKLS